MSNLRFRIYAQSSDFGYLVVSFGLKILVNWLFNTGITHGFDWFLRNLANEEGK